MPTYIAQVKNASGKSLSQKIDAVSPEQARVFLRKRYRSIGRIRKASFLDMDIDLMLSGVSIKDKAVFSRQFAAMIDAGVAIVRCLSVLAEQTTNPKLKKALVGISAEVQQGVSLSEAMGKHPQCFDRLYVSMIESGETGGVLDEVLNRLAKLLEDMARLANQIKSAMAYPTAIAIFTVLVFLGMTIFLIPTFAAIFEDLGAELPGLTQFMLEVSDVLRSWRIFAFIGIAAAVVFGIRQYYKTPPGRLQIDGLMLKIPLFGDLLQKTAIARFCRVFGSLTRSGVPILSSLDIVGDTVGNQVIANAVDEAKAEITRGGMISLALQKKRVFPPLAIQMISIGEETGELDSMIMKVADFYEDEVESSVKALTSLLEPIMMVAVAGMVGVILLAMYLPMFSIFDQLA